MTKPTREQAISGAMIERTIRRATMRQRWHLALMALFLFITLLSLGVIGRWLIQSAPGTNGLLPAALATVLSTVLLLRLAAVEWQERRAYRALAGSGREAVSDALAATRRRLRVHRLLMVGLPGGLMPLLTVAVGQLVLNGKMAGDEALSFAVLTGFILLSVLAVIRHRIRRDLRPACKALSALEAQFDD